MTYYIFFDGAAIDAVWRLPWKEFFQRHPGSQARISELIEFGYNPVGVGGREATKEELQAVFATKTIAWTIRRSTPQFFLMNEIICHIRQLRRHSLSISTYYTEDCFALVAAAIDGWARGEVGKRTLEAILKLHSFEQVRHWLDLPRRLAGQIKQVIPLKRFSKPLYGWQGPEACCQSPFGVTDYERDNCLNCADTRRLVAFVARAWNENRPISYLKADTNGSFSADLAEDASPEFRRLDVAKKIVTKQKTITAFTHPCVFRFLT